MKGGALVILFEESDQKSELFESIYNAYDKGRGFIELKDFLQNVDFTRFWTYDGSQDTPPCFEGLKWTVVRSI